MRTYTTKNQGDRIAQNVAQQIFFKIAEEKSNPIFGGATSVIKKTAQSKHLSHRRKFAQSGHPANYWTRICHIPGQQDGE
jgi:hypothetical protein